jgi:hypothetical protein
MFYYQFAREAAGALGARHSPRPLIDQKADVAGKNSRDSCGEIAKLRLQAALFEK